MTVRRLFIILLAAGAGFAGYARAELLDAVVATVDREVILHSDILTEIRPLVEGVSPQSAEYQEIYEAALDQAIDQKILYREGILAGATLPDEYVDERMKDVLSGEGQTDDEFLTAIQDAGESLSDFRERFKKKLIAWHIANDKREQLKSQMVISEAELAQYYQDHIDEFNKPERVKLYRIFIAAENSEADRARAIARMEALREELKLGAEFTQLASNHSEGPFAVQGGFAGWIERGEILPELEDVAFALNPGDVSPIIEYEHGVMLLKVEEKVEAGIATFDQVRTEIEPELREDLASERYGRWISELRKRSRVRKYL